MRARMGYCCALLSLCLFPVALAQAQQLPAPRTVEARILQQPDISESPVEWTLTYDLTAVSREANVVRWRVDRLTVRWFDEAGALRKNWSRVNPPLATEDGLWLMWHADPLLPSGGDDWRPPQYMEFVTGEGDDHLLVYLKPTSQDQVDFAFRPKSDPKPLDSGDDVPLIVTTSAL